MTVWGRVNCYMLGGNLKKFLCSFVCLFLASGCAISPEPNFAYYKNSDPTSCHLVVGLSQEDNLYVYEVTTDSRSVRGNFMKNGQTIVFSDLFASKPRGDFKVKVSASLQGDTLQFQNYGNSMNPFTLFSECDSKYLSLVRVRI